MKDTELRGIVLQKFYDNRRIDFFRPEPKHFEPTLDGVDIFRICEQLKDHQLLNLTVYRPIDGVGTVIGRISAHGVDVIEGEATPEIKVHFVQHNTTNNISSSTGVIVGDNNQQNVTQHVEGLIRAIEASDGTPEEKAEAKSRLKSFLEHPLLAAVVGGALGLL